MDRRNRFITTLSNLIFRIYKLIFSPMLTLLLGGACKYQPTCSEYAHQAVTKHGVLKGSLLSSYRVLRCNPLSKGGYDPA